MIQPSYQEFRVLAKRGNLIPVYQELLMDLETPLSFFKRLERDRYAFLLESVEGSERWARYSFLGTRPYRVFKARGSEVEIIEGGKSRRYNSEAPLKALEQLLKNCRPVSVAGVPPFFGGALGYVSYNAVEQFHLIRNGKKDPLELPEIFFLFVQTLIAFDNLKHTIKVIDNVQLDVGTYLRGAYDASVRRIRNVISTLQKKPRGIEPRDVSQNRKNRKFRSNLSKSQFASAVVKGKAYIKAGDIIQVVLCQRLETETETDPFEIYRALRFINPSPYMFYLELEDLRIIGSSPETMVRLSGDTIELRPIAGTRPRGATAEEEQALEADLLGDPKERAEHIMLVDLGRNDVGRIAEIGSVELSQVLSVERYSHVMHLCSTVTGRMRPGTTAFDALRACLPAGTLSGAPKVRAMEIIDELEPCRRGPYGGAVGYVDFSGNMDTCIALRTLVLKGQTAYLQAGAGIVADSVPALEYEETMNKAR